MVHDGAPKETSHPVVSISVRTDSVLRFEKGKERELSKQRLAWENRRHPAAVGPSCVDSDAKSARYLRMGCCFSALPGNRLEDMHRKSAHFPQFF